MIKHFWVAEMLHSQNPKGEEHVWESATVKHPPEVRYNQLGA